MMVVVRDAEVWDLYNGETILVDDEDAAIAFADVLWDIYRPPHVREENDVTETYAYIFIHPGFPPHEADAGLVRVRVDTEQQVHEEADEHAFDALLQPYVDSGDVTAGEMNSIRNRINARRGKTTNIRVVLPAHFKQTLMTGAEMETAGWFD